jgi:hypothetical protein
MIQTHTELCAVNEEAKLLKTAMEQKQNVKRTVE